MNITLAHTKGGVTKSSIATNLTVWLHGKGHKVAAVDLDAGKYGNKSLTTVIRQAVPEIPVFQPETPEALKELLPKLAEEFHFTVADAPGGFQTTAETNLELLRHTDFVLVPVKPDFDDIEPLSVVAEVIAEAKRENPLLEGRVIINCLDGRTRTARDLGSLLESIKAIAPSLKVMAQTIRVDRNAFQSARLNGMAVVQAVRSGAKDDLNSLFAELLSDMIVTINQHGKLASNQGGEAYEAKAING